MRIIVTAVTLATLFCLVVILASCGGANVRYDGAPSPASVNHNTVLLEVVTARGGRQLGFGQAGISFGADEAVSGSLIIHTPLPGAVTLYSSRCGIDQKDYHPENGGAFHYDLANLFEQVPYTVQSCVVSIHVTWELPKGWKSEYPLEGMTGKLYYKRGGTGSSAPTLQWIPQYKNIAAMNGVGFAQFRSSVTRDDQPFPVSEPLVMKIKLTKRVVKDGKWRLYGCDQGIELADFAGDEILVSRDSLIGMKPVMGGCLMLGWAVGTTEDGSKLDDDFAVGVEVFDYSVMHVSGKVTVTDSEICYQTENTVTGCVLNHGNTNELSNDLEHCFKRPTEPNPILGCWTHKGRAVYAAINGTEVEYIH